MTNPDFQDWLSFHRATFTGFSAWLAKLPEDAPEGEPTRRDVLRSWWFVLRGCELADCRAATGAMAAGRIEEPKGYDRHKTIIRQYADKLAAERRRRATVPQPRYYDGEAAVKCPLCRDIGLIWIYHPETTQAALDGRLDREPTIYRSAAKCDCEASQRHPQCGFPEYRSDLFAKMTPGLRGDAAREELMAWCHRQAAPIPEGF